MARQLTRADSLYKQLADILRDEITQGIYAPGDPLPSEAQMLLKYGVSRTTLREALTVLRGEGLTEARHGKGTFVRSGLNATITVLNRPRTAGLHSIDEPRISRQDADQATAALLNIREGEALFVCEATTADPATGHRVLTRTVLPFAAAERTELEDNPFPARAALIATLAKQHGKLTTVEYVRTHMPNPDQATALALPAITPLLETAHVTSAKGRAVLAEIETTSGEGIRLAYPIQPKP